MAKSTGCFEITLITKITSENKGCWRNFEEKGKKGEGNNFRFRKVDLIVGTFRMET